MKLLSLIALGALYVYSTNGAVVQVRQPTTITSAPYSTPSSSSSSSSTSCSYSRCVDYINSCGMMYGGCFLDPMCGGSIPTFTTPACTTVVTSVSAGGCPYQDCVYVSNPCGASIHTCFLAGACGGSTPGPITSTCAPNTSSSSTEVDPGTITDVPSSSTTTTTTVTPTSNIV